MNLVLVCEGEEEIGSPNFPQVVQRADIQAALKKCVGVIIPLGSQGLDGSVEINLGAKGIVELELVSSGEKWGRGPDKDVHSSLFAQLGKCDEAARLVVAGFFQQVFDRITIPPVREALSAAIGGRIRRVS